MVGRSSRGLRRVLRQAGVQFSTPLWSGSDDRVSEVDAEGDQIFDQLEKQHPSKVCDSFSHASSVCFHSEMKIVCERRVCNNSN